jgi:hypothetical protein
MGIVLIDNSGYIRITDTNNASLQLDLFKSTITNVDPKSYGGTDDYKIIIRQHGSLGKDDVALIFRKITTPLTASPNDLADIISAWIDTTDAKTTSGTFVNGDLVAGVLTIAHGKGAEAFLCHIEDPSGESELLTFTNVDADTVTVDFGGAIAAGTWSYYLYHK